MSAPTRFHSMAAAGFAILLALVTGCEAGNVEPSTETNIATPSPETTTATPSPETTTATPATEAATATPATETSVVEPSTGGLGVLGADISSTLQVEAANKTVNLEGQVLPIEVILARSGATHARFRVWVDPQSGINDLTAGLLLAKRAHAAGMKLVLSLQYSDTWADPRFQKVPAAWSNLTAAELPAKVQSYTRETVKAFADQGTPIDIIQVGNEINHGFLWPFGEIYRDGGEHWDGFLTLLKWSIEGAKEGNPSQPPAIMIHVSTLAGSGHSTYFFDHLQEHGVSYDLIGLSYYPFWHGPMSALANEVETLATRYRKDIVIAETGYPWTLDTGDTVPTLVSDAGSLPDGDLFPPTPDGQEKFFRALGQLLSEAPHGHGAGFLIWEPGWLPGVPVAENLGNMFNNLTLFDWSGAALPALKAFQK